MKDKSEGKGCIDCAVKDGKNCYGCTHQHDTIDRCKAINADNDNKKED